jgi:hypothetical protein
MARLTCCNKDLMARAVNFLHLADVSFIKAADIGMKNKPAYLMRILWKYTSEWVITVSRQMSNFSVISGREQVTFDVIMMKMISAF